MPCRHLVAVYLDFDRIVALWPASRSICRQDGWPRYSFAFKPRTSALAATGLARRVGVVAVSVICREVSPRFSFVRPSCGRDADMLESLLIVLALTWTAACLAVGTWFCAGGETILDIRRGDVGKPWGVTLAGLLRSDSGRQWCALGTARARAVFALAAALTPVVPQRFAVLPGAAPRSELCGRPSLRRGGSHVERNGPRAEGGFSIADWASD